MGTNNSKKWWQDSRFGMFIHWGIYSLLAKGEWVMYTDRISVREYEKLADEFNPVKFDAEEWVKLAKNSGMKYIVITAKHHDGFSMFKTNVDTYNIVDGTPYKRDIMSELSQACQKYDIKLCFYYSHVREWRHPHAQSLESISPFKYGNFGNFWDYQEEYKKNLQIYIDEFDKPQIKELLTQYGPIGIIWFDTPSLIRPDQAQELVDLVKSIQPDCLVNSRVGDSVEPDYYSLGDCEIPDFNTGVDFETPMTICDAWGYNKMSGNKYRSKGELIHQLIDIVSKGGNYLLNVGPDFQGVIPAEAQERLMSLGEWIKVNGESIYSTKASPFPNIPTWGRITAKEDSLYLHIYDWRSVISLTGLKSKVESAVLLADRTREIICTQEQCGSLGYDKLMIQLPGDAPDPDASVLKLQFAKSMQLESRIIEDDSGAIQLPACLAKINSSADSPQAVVSIVGVVQKWMSDKDWFSWEFICENPGVFNLSITVSSGFHGIWDFGHEVVFACNGQEKHLTIEDTGMPTDHFQKRTFSAGTIRIDNKGLNYLSLRAAGLVKQEGQGLTMATVNLSPEKC